jgi:hypothetical protein
MINGKVVAARNLSLRNPRRERQIVRYRYKREVKTEMNRKGKKGINIRVGLIWLSTTPDCKDL